MFKSAFSLFLFLCMSTLCAHAKSLESTNRDNTSKSTRHHGGTVLSISDHKFTETGVKTLGEVETELEARKQYQEFLSRGRYSRMRSIGFSYSGGSSKSYSTGRTGAVAIKSKPRKRFSTRARFATINNRQGNLGSSRGNFATINNSSGRRR